MTDSTRDKDVDRGSRPRLSYKTCPTIECGPWYKFRSIREDSFTGGVRNVVANSCRDGMTREKCLELGDKI